MNNPLPLRILMTVVIVLGTAAVIVALGFMKFPDYLFVIFFSVALGSGFIYFVIKKEQAARFKVYYSTVQELGTPISYNKHSAAFQHGETRFDIVFPKNEHHNAYHVTFYLPNLSQKFSIQNKTIATRYDSDCQIIQESPLPPEYLLQSRKPEFLLELLKIPDIRNEILNYGASFWGRFYVSFNDGSFEIEWVPPVGEQIDGIYTICRTAVVFHDELKKLQKEK